MVSSQCVGQTHSEEQRDKTSGLTDINNFLKLLFGNTADFIGDILTAKEGSQGVEDFVVVALLDADKGVGNFCSVGLTAVNTDDLSSFLSLCGEETTGEDGVSGHMTRVSVCRVASPEDNAVSTVLDFSKSTGRNSGILNCKKGRSMADSSAVIDDTTGLLCKRVTCRDCFTVGGGPSIE